MALTGNVMSKLVKLKNDAKTAVSSKRSQGGSSSRTLSKMGLSRSRERDREKDKDALTIEALSTDPAPPPATSNNMNIVGELGVVFSRIHGLESSLMETNSKLEETMRRVEEMGTSMSMQFKEVNEKLTQLSSGLEQEKFKRRKNTAKINSQHQEFMNLCSGVAENISKLHEHHKRDEAKEDPVELIASLEGRLVTLEGSVEAAINGARLNASSRRTEEESYQERVLYKLQGKVSLIEERMDQLNSLRLQSDKKEKDKDKDKEKEKPDAKICSELKALSAKIKQLGNNTSSTCSHLSSGLSDVQSSALNLFAWAEQVQSTLEQNKEILGMGTHQRPLPQLRIGTWSGLGLGDSRLDGSPPNFGSSRVGLRGSGSPGRF